MNYEVTHPTDHSSPSDFDARSGLGLIDDKSEEATSSRLRFIVFMMACITATVGWLLFLMTAAFWLVGF